MAKADVNNTYLNSCIKTKSSKKKNNKLMPSSSNNDLSMFMFYLQRKIIPHRIHSNSATHHT